MHTRHLKQTTQTQSQTRPTGSTIETRRAPVETVQNDHPARLVSTDEIRQCAYEKWERAGTPIGDGIQFWLEAEQELAQGI